MGLRGEVHSVAQNAFLAGLTRSTDWVLKKKLKTNYDVSLIVRLI